MAAQTVQIPIPAPRQVIVPQQQGNRFSIGGGGGQDLATLLALLSFLEQSESREERSQLAEKQFGLQEKVAEAELLEGPRNRASARALKRLAERRQVANTDFEKGFTESTQSSFDQGQRDARPLTREIGRMSNRLAGSKTEQNNVRDFLETGLVPKLRTLLEREDIRADEFRFRGAVSEVMGAVNNLAGNRNFPLGDRGFETALQIFGEQTRNLAQFASPREFVFSGQGPFGKQLAAGFADLQRQMDVASAEVSTGLLDFRGEPESFEREANRIVQRTLQKGFTRPDLSQLVPFRSREDLFIDPSTEAFRKPPVDPLAALESGALSALTPTLGERGAERVVGAQAPLAGALTIAGVAGANQVTRGLGGLVESLLPSGLRSLPGTTAPGKTPVVPLVEPPPTPFLNDFIQSISPSLPNGSGLSAEQQLLQQLSLLRLR